MTTQALQVAPAAEAGPALSRGAGRAVLAGNEMIVKGALEAGVSLITGYPGSPVAEVFLVCEEHAGQLRELGVEAVLANNEAQSAAMLNGARQVPGARAMTVFKSVGTYVALDALAIANSSKAAKDAAAVVVVGDDTLSSSTQVGADSRITLSAGSHPRVGAGDLPGGQGPRPYGVRPVRRVRADCRGDGDDHPGRWSGRRRSRAEPLPGGWPAKPDRDGHVRRARRPLRVASAVHVVARGGHPHPQAPGPQGGGRRARAQPRSSRGRARTRPWGS